MLYRYSGTWSEPALPSSRPHVEPYPPRAADSSWPGHWLRTGLSLVRRSGASRRVMTRSAATSMVRVGVARCCGRMAAALPVLPVGFVRRQTLDDPITGQHAVVDRKASADHERTHGGILTRQLVRLVGKIRLILPSVDQYQAGIARGLPIAFVCRLCPSTTLAEACGRKKNVH